MTEISQTLLSVIERNAQAYPDKIAYSFLNDMLQETSHCTYSQLIKRSKNFASYLVNKSAQGKTVLLMFNPGLDFIIAFLLASTQAAFLFLVIQRVLLIKI